MVQQDCITGASWECWDVGLIHAQHSGLRIQRCHSCSLVQGCSSNLIPVPGAPYAMGQPKKKRRKKKKDEVDGGVLICYYLNIQL